MPTDPLPSLVTISIATKDRPQVLEETLRKIHAFGLGECPVILCDDGSEPPLSPAALALFPNGRLLRNEQAQGQALARNRIVRECATPYLLQLDDDSYPVAGDLAALLTFAQSRSDWFALALPFEEPVRGRDFPTGIPREEAVQVKSFVGCSVLFEVSKFNRMGGYAEWIGKMVEEEELCLLALSKGHAVLSIDLLRIRHDVTEIARNRDGITRLCFRNWFILWCVHGPISVLPWRLLRLGLGAAFMTLKQRSPNAIEGVVDAIRMLPVLWSKRSPVSMPCYREFQTLPHALDYFEKNDLA